MRENVLRLYFSGQLPTEALEQDLAGAMVPGSRPGAVPKVVRHPIVDMVGDFEVQPEHLIRLCDDLLAGNLPYSQLQAIAICLVLSEHFFWDDEVSPGDRVDATVNAWAAPEINYALNPNTVKKFRHRLLTGENILGPGDYFSDSLSGSGPGAA